MVSQDIFGYSDLQHLRIRLTEYSKVNLILGSHLMILALLIIVSLLELRSLLSLAFTILPDFYRNKEKEICFFGSEDCRYILFIEHFKVELEKELAISLLSPCQHKCKVCMSR